MIKAVARLTGAIILLALTANAESPAFEASAFPSASAVIAFPERLISSDRIDVADPNRADRPITEWKFDAEFTVTQLAGPDVGKKARISFIDQREWRAGKLFMIVHRDGVGRLWARRAWQEVDSQLCLSAQQVAKLGLIDAFLHAHHNDEGQRCIKV